ncbi:SDR family NAD(P)-dependent oxidoreductase [Sphingomonas naphthae]|uniref:SDR family NAD(P)-dependent oxidoreductase n=1 Tax=Sphingomonas naphthae TaxID=1813468 RepID=A0ABY7TRR0_9SPHN|nr:SDR family oxidoreductase [Sphingomonas naphthae]WCT74529.1 SDR family NAD(P)-dependent oxidoreductase [Sphingomonas naphthae]
MESNSSGAVQRLALVTGAGGGLGTAMVLALVDAGHRVICAEYDAALLTALFDQVSDEARARLYPLIVDLTQADQVDGLIDRAEAEHGPIDILVNNAGVATGIVRGDIFRRPVISDEMSPRIARRMFEINAIAPFSLCLQLLPKLKARGWGRVINVTTSADSLLRLGNIGYGGTKAALEAHSAILAQELPGTGVTMNVIVPGGITNTAIIPDDCGWDRANMLQPDVMVPPLMWLLGDEGAAANCKRIVGSEWQQPVGEAGIAAMNPIGWPTPSKAFFPTLP